MKKVLSAILVLIILLMICTGCSKPATDSDRFVRTAKVRYFDGSMETIRITGYSPVGGCIWLKADDGHIALIGANNVIIVEDEDY